MVIETVILSILFIILIDIIVTKGEIFNLIKDIIKK